MSVIANGSIDKVLLQQSLISSPPENPVFTEDKIDSGRQEAVIIDIADIKASSWVKFNQEAVSKSDRTDSVSNPIELNKTQGSVLNSTIAAQEAVLQEKQNQLEIKASSVNVEFLRSFITKDQNMAMVQQANQSKEHTIALIN